MTETSQNKKTNKQGRRVVPVLCNIIGYLIIIITLVVCVPISVPKAMGYTEFVITSGSMEPTIPVGSLIYVMPYSAQELEADDIIAFYEDTSVVCHRVVDNQHLEGKLVTKGDANEEVDPQKRDYNSLIGIVKFHLPFLGLVAGILGTTLGKLYSVLILICGLLFVILGHKMR